MNGPGQTALQRLLQAVERFCRVETLSATLLVVTTAVALLWANGAPSSYDTFWRQPPASTPPPFLSTLPLQLWINDGLMTLFFLLVGLEIRAEWHDGVLSQRRYAILPIAAALGGVVVPALIFLGLNIDPVLRRGWGVPMATDIAFSAGALALLGGRVPSPLRVLLLTLAIVDDIAAVLVIAAFYSGGIGWQGLLTAACGVAAAVGLRFVGIGTVLVYALPGVVIWYGLWRAGIHPTLAGVLLGVLLPMSSRRALADMLHPWVAYGVMPIFALANAGVDLHSLGSIVVHHPRLVGGVLFGLVIGKPVGILAGSFICMKSGLGALAPPLGWRHLVVLGCLGGIGFTMSIFMADLAFPPGELLTGCKSAVLLASAVAAMAGLAIGRIALAPRVAAEPAPPDHA